MSQMLRDKRISRGTRMAELVGEAAEEDEAFWNHDIWQEAESDDESFEEGEVKPDIFDSDFNDSETEEESDSDDEKAASKRQPAASSSNKYKEPPKKTLYLSKRKVNELSGDASVPKKLQRKEATQREYDHFTGRTVRQSTLAKTANADIARNEKDELVKATRKPSRPRIKTHFKQKDLLLESLDTEELNKKWLVTQKLVEDERAQADRPAKAPTDGGYVRFSSRRGSFPTITFTHVDDMPAVLLLGSAPKPPEQALCVITGLPAKYKDPRTGQPYRDAGAFKELRRRAAANGQLTTRQ